MKIRILFAGNFNIGPKAIHCEAGEILEADVSDAYRLIEGLCAEAVLEDDPPEEPPKLKGKVKHGDG
jgi:hypothetical protein